MWWIMFAEKYLLTISLGWKASRNTDMVPLEYCSYLPNLPNLPGQLKSSQHKVTG